MKPKKKLGEMEPTPLDEIMRKCIRVEEAYSFNNVPGEPVIHAVGIKPKKEKARWAEVHPGLTGKVLLSGYHNTPTVVMLKCKDIRAYMKKMKRTDGLARVTETILDKFRKRK